MRNLAYLKVIIRHKIGVLIGCFKVGCPIWLGIVHDLSKFSRVEWIGYSNFFYDENGKKIERRDIDGNYVPALDNGLFRDAWFHHLKYNKHHWQYWIVVRDEGKLRTLDIPRRYVLEMVADWVGAGWAYANHTDPTSWYRENRYKMTISDTTEQIIEDILAESFPQ